MKINKMVFVEDWFEEDTFNRFLYDYEVIDHTEYNTYEISSHNIRTFEDVVAEGKALTEEEHTGWEYPTDEERDYLRETIGSDVYDLLLNEEIDFVMIVR